MKKRKRCHPCRGTGHVQREWFPPPPEPEEQALFDFLGVDVGRFFSWVTCAACNGTGRKVPHEMGV